MQEDRRVEYTALRAEILQSDRTCLLMMGYLFAAVGFLYANEQEWLVSFLSFVALCYFTEKRFNIRLLSSHTADTISKNADDFTWDKNIPTYRKEGKIRPLRGVRPYNVEASTCLLAALSPFIKLSSCNINSNSSNIFDFYNPLNDFWLFFVVLTIFYSLLGFIKYNSQPDLTSASDEKKSKYQN